MSGRLPHGALVTRIRGEALSTAEVIAHNAPISVRQAKQAIVRGLNMSLFDGLVFETEAYYRTIPTEDRREGITSSADDFC